MEEHGELTLKDYEIPKNELKILAEKATRLRSKIMNKAQAKKLAESKDDDEYSISQNNKSKIYSTKARSLDGLSEG